MAVLCPAGLYARRQRQCTGRRRAGLGGTGLRAGRRCAVCGWCRLAFCYNLCSRRLGLLSLWLLLKQFTAIRLRCLLLLLLLHIHWRWAILRLLRRLLLLLLSRHPSW